jgi:hypothetical protein
MKSKKISKVPFRLILILLILAAAAAVILSADRLFDFTFSNPFVRKERTVSSSVILKQVKDIGKLNTVEFIYKTVFPFDLVQPDTDWNYLVESFSSGKKLNFNEIEMLSILGISLDAGIDLLSESYSFIVITARITAGFEFSETNFENADDVIFIDVEKNSIKIKLPPVTITDIVIEDEDSSSYGYPDLDISPEKWKTLTSILSRMLKTEAEERNITGIAQERGEEFIRKLLTSAGYSSVEFIRL